MTGKGGSRNRYAPLCMPRSERERRAREGRKRPQDLTTDYKTGFRRRLFTLCNRLLASIHQNLFCMPLKLVRLPVSPLPRLVGAEDTERLARIHRTPRARSENSSIRGLGAGPFGGRLATVPAHVEAREAGASTNSITAARTFRIDLADNS